MQQLIFGNIAIPLLPPFHSASFRPLKEHPVNSTQQALLTALWRASTPMTKHSAINALNIYFSSLLPTYYAVFTGKQPGIYTNNSFSTVQEQQWCKFHSFDAVFNALAEVLKTTEFYTKVGSANLTSFTQEPTYDQLRTENLKHRLQLKSIFL